MTIRRYAQRLLNPFRGVMNIIECQGAEAVTVDGIHWDIYVRDTELVQDIQHSARVQTSDIRYGHWSEKEGLKRGSLYPSDDFKVLEHRGAIVYEDLLTQHARVPFPLQDHFELWLLDEHGQPLTLLNSVVREAEIEPDCPIDWRAGQECRRCFHSPALDQLTTDSVDGGSGAYLTRYINSLAGNPPQAHWFQRLPDGSGVGLLGVPDADRDRGRVLPSTAFPGFFLREAPHPDAHQQLVRDFIDWQAPWLLLLHGLDREVRARLERLAQSQALHMEKQHRLYPQIIDRELLSAARVEAALRRNQPDQITSEDTLSTYYIELNITRTN